MTTLLLTNREISRRIYFIRGHRVMLDSDLAELYGVPTKRLNLAVKRNLARFPEDFMFQLADEEQDRLRQQVGVSEPAGRGGRRYLPYAFTEHGVTMLASVLSSDRAIQVNIAVVRAFVRLRELLETHHDLAAKLEKLERNYDVQFKVVFDAIRQLMAVTTASPRRRIRGLSEK
jgi:hypothetical protein